MPCLSLAIGCFFSTLNCGVLQATRVQQTDITASSLALETAMPVAAPGSLARRFPTEEDRPTTMTISNIRKWFRKVVIKMTVQNYSME